jgi:hypothetical protein
VVVVLVLAAVAAAAVAVDKYKDEIVPVHAEVITKLNSELTAMQVLVSTGHIYTYSKLLQLPVFAVMPWESQSVKLLLVHLQSQRVCFVFWPSVRPSN